ncbi:MULTISPECIES: bifunctional lytic transglycosylase/C40 family peptidase [unclassified Crossiella]|uniref:C40 family peptidase n=1 Tax=unclassified Crossiella TaxID=2620835 RepID=UPI001FFFCD55|nr:MULTISPECIES: bifunctional lytic transglycosylase/C40 family peptidase [unclassified Crossiella]MCK2241855.1 bifunctional lytic transglycosylase/C40 family peptidase [Crossiella sp. S99.2]MCK2255758.1 bifunctional lytic transglycosylase/C40 family peptidase [Crossiella sp. S99.1]
MKFVLAAMAVIVAIPVVLAAFLIHLATSVTGTTGSHPGAEALADTPGNYLVLYRTAATQCPGLDWSILAAIGKVETDHGRSPLPGVHGGQNPAGAGGPMQFLQPTFDEVVRRHRFPSGGATPPSRYDPHDAIHAAAHYLCDSGARHRQDLYRAIFTYNRADWYVRKVLAQAERYANAAAAGTGNCDDIQALSPAAHAAIRFACQQLGQPYVWGGDGGAEGGFDCSGLTKAAYAHAGIHLPRTAHTQFHAGPRVPAGQPLLPGDLVFYGNPHIKIRHVGLYLGNSKMINAPTFGQPVQIDDHRYKGDDFAGATRPASKD